MADLTAAARTHATPTLPNARSREQELIKVRQLAKLLDSAYRVPGTNFRVGWDTLLGLVPGVGDAATGLAAAAIIAYAMKLGVRKRVIVRMLANVGIDVAVGTIPLVGDLFDAAFKANNRNVALIERDLASAGKGIVSQRMREPTAPHTVAFRSAKQAREEKAGATA